jgi:hypothetical protein
MPQRNIFAIIIEKFARFGEAITEILGDLRDWGLKLEKLQTNAEFTKTYGTARSLEKQSQALLADKGLGEQEAGVVKALGQIAAALNIQAEVKDQIDQILPNRYKSYGALIEGLKLLKIELKSLSEKYKELPQS